MGDRSTDRTRVIAEKRGAPCFPRPPIFPATCICSWPRLFALGPSSARTSWVNSTDRSVTAFISRVVEPRAVLYCNYQATKTQASWECELCGGLACERRLIQVDWTNARVPRVGRHKRDCLGPPARTAAQPFRGLCVLCLPAARGDRDRPTEETWAFSGTAAPPALILLLPTRPSRNRQEHLMMPEAPGCAS